MKKYDRLIELSRQISVMDSVGKLLAWDQQTFMPAKAAGIRAKQRACLAQMAHQLMVSEELHTLLQDLHESQELRSLGPGPVANVRELKRRHDREYVIPARLVAEIEETVGIADGAWKQAKKSGSFQVFAPWLQRLVTLHKEMADAVGYRHERYDALIDRFEPGACVRELAPLFASLRVDLVKLLDTLLGVHRTPDTSILNGPYDREKMRQFALDMAGEVGFDFGAGRMDRSEHPFCEGMGMSDVRVTTYFNDANPLDTLFAAAHEIGHGLYHQGLPPEHWGTPLGVAPSLGIHEAQARWWENIIARSRPFWENFFPKLKKTFPNVLDGQSLDEFVGAINVVGPSFIRVEADEVTYNLHIVLRFELECAIFRDEIAIDDLPDAWNEKTKQYLDITPPNPAVGVLQDIHWSHGLFGYFPTYTLGNLYGAQLNRQVRCDIPEMDREVSAGDFRKPLQWMRQHVHRHGSLYPAAELIAKATGEPLGTQSFMDYLVRKYTVLYNT